jgi:pyrroloquinoline-quinone synthase
MDADEFQERLLEVMERKVHWAEPAFRDGLVPKHRLHVHLEQEYATYVRDFPLMLGRAHAQCPIAAVRRELAENLYEEETGGLSGGRPHPQLFLEYPRGLGMDLKRFEHVGLLPAAAAYRALLDDATTARGWEIATAVTTIFLEGTRYERGEVDPSAPKRPQPRYSQHPLVKHYGLSQEHLALTKAHRNVEGDHRQAAWRIIREHVGARAREGVVSWMEDALGAWHRYRDDVAQACGIERGSDGQPVRLAS